MTDNTNIETRTERALLADLRQKLLAPVNALLGYGQLLQEQSVAPSQQEFAEDIDKIVSAAGDLYALVDSLVGDQLSAEFLDMDTTEAERQLRHDLRTPINAIKGYSEMLLEDIDEPSEGLGPDLAKILRESNNLLGELDDLVSFSINVDTLPAGTKQSGDNSVVSLIDSLKQVDESSLRRETGNILVVDDIEANRDLLSRRLARDGHQVSTANDGREALLLLENETYDLVLLDLMMPGINGFDTLNRIKTNDRLRHIPVIMVSALKETDSVVRCIESGAHDYLLKPIDPILLKARIASGLESKRWSDDEKKQRQFIKQAFSRFISPAIVEQLANDPSRLSLGGERMDITSVFTDLEGFTSLIERNAPAAVLPVLNRYLDGLCQIFLAHDGTIDKIVGDALHGFFGAPVAHPDHASKAMKCVLELDQYARKFIEQDDAKDLGFGVTRIGVHSGVAVVGNFGGEAFFDYTAHGDVINTAARLESANKHLGTSICASAETKSYCPEIPFRPIGHVVLKGKTESIAAFEPSLHQGLGYCQYSDYLDAYQLMDTQDSTAEGAFNLLALRFPDDPLVQLHSQRLASGDTGSLIVMNEK